MLTIKINVKVDISNYSTSLVTIYDHLLTYYLHQYLRNLRTKNFVPYKIAFIACGTPTGNNSY